MPSPSKEHDWADGLEAGLQAVPAAVAGPHIRLPSLEAFYLSPYLTCGECNKLAFINSTTIRSAPVKLSQERERLAAQAAAAEERRRLADSDSDLDLEPEASEAAAEAGTLAGTLAGTAGVGASSPEDERGAVRALPAHPRRADRELDLVYGLRLEALPRCPGCRRTHAWRVGALDLTSLIHGNARERRRRRWMQIFAAVRLQRLVRARQARRRVGEMRRAHLERLAFLFLCASRVQAVVRGRLERRAAEVERSLAVIRDAHPILMAEALRPWKGVSVFWYKRPEELRLLYRDYRLLVQRTGNEPPLYRVEKNINTVAARVSLLMAQRAVRIQKRVRGMIGRKFIRQYRVERAFQTCRAQASALLLQRAVRSWTARRVRRVLHLRRLSERLGRQYEAERAAARAGAQAGRLRERLKAAYAADVQLDRMGKRLHPGRGQLAPVLRAANTVPCGKQLNDFFLHVREEREHEEQALEERRQYLQRKTDAKPAFAGYFADELAPPRKAGSAFLRELLKYKTATQGKAAARRIGMAVLESKELVVPLRDELERAIAKPGGPGDRRRQHQHRQAFMAHAGHDTLDALASPAAQR